MIASKDFTYIMRAYQNRVLSFYKATKQDRQDGIHCQLHFQSFAADKKTHQTSQHIYELIRLVLIYIVRMLSYPITEATSLQGVVLK